MTENDPDPIGRAIINATEHERRTLGSELHETICQTLASISIAAGVLSRRIKNGKTIEQADFEQLEELVQHATDEARSLVRSLNSAWLDSGSLIPALRELAETAARTIPTEFVCESPSAMTEPRQALALYRIAQEGLRHALKSPNVTRISLMLSQNDARVVLDIRANGAGDTLTLDSSMIGVQLMQFHAGAIGAELACHSAEDQGTAITCVLPKAG